VAPLAVVPGFHPVEDRRPRLLSGRERASAHRLLLERGVERFADGVVVVGPLEPIDCAIPASRERRPKSSDTYCEPWSEWQMSRRSQTPILVKGSVSQLWN
jgi:hypothetical protein